MSKLKIQEPVLPIVHLPSYRKWGVPGHYVSQIVKQLGFEPLYPGVHAWYWYTNEKGCVELLPHLILKSGLYKKDIFTCINYAFKGWNECSSRFGLNTWVPLIGRIPGVDVKHAWILIMIGDEMGLHPDKFLYFEPNDGYSFGVELETAYQAFPIGEEGYQGELLFY